MNNKIKTTATVVSRTEYKYTTTDGGTFTDLFLAEMHQKWLDGDIIECSECHGAKGKMDDQDEDGRKPKKWVDCKRCSGKGYLERKVVYE